MATLGPCPAMGIFTSVLVDSVGATFSDSSFRMEPLGENLEREEALVGGEGLTGRIDFSIAKMRTGPRFARGTLPFYPTAADFAYWLPWILGGSVSAPTYNAGDVFPQRDFLLKRDWGNVHRYNKMQCNYFVLEGREELQGEDPQTMRALIGALGYDEVMGNAWPNPEPGLPSGLNPIWLFGDATLTIGGDTVPMSRLRIVINNNLRPFARNNLTLQCIRSAGREISIDIDVPYNDDTRKFYSDDFAYSVVINFLATKNFSGSPTARTQFSFVKCVRKRKTPNAQSREEIPQTLNLVAKLDPANASTPICVVTNVVNT